MKLFVLLLLMLSLNSFAGEKYLGVIVSAGGGDTTNGTTATPFKISFGSKLTVYCTAAASVCTDTTTACTTLGGANAGLQVASSANVPTSVSQAATSTNTDTSGTAANGGAIMRIVAAGGVSCYVWSRNGNE